MTSYAMPSNFADHVLVASPNSVVRQRVYESLRSPNRHLVQAKGGAEALGHLETGSWQVLFLDRRLPDLDAEELRDTVRQRFPGIEVVLIDPEIDSDLTSKGGAELTVAERGADGVQEARPAPFDPELEDCVLPTSSCSSSANLAPPLPGMIGSSFAMQPVYRLARLLAPRNTAVLITGPTGCGKEIVA